MAKQASDQRSAAEAYDEVPSSGRTHPHTSPANLYSIARLLGHNASDPRTARVLEIGCALGNNIASMAALFPESTCVGLDYSRLQIEVGHRLIKATGLKNLELKHMSIMDVTKEFGMFDYIIAHGVYSWVPPEVQDKVMEVCKTNLTPNGVALISYNTLPAWNTVRSIREMLIYHTERFKDPAVKIKQARLLLQDTVDMLQRGGSHNMAALVEYELNRFKEKNEFYLLREYLEDSNYQFYFSDFVKDMEEVGLQYLADTDLRSMSVNNISGEMAKMLETADDQIRAEQYMDFFTNRRFRNTLMCHKEIKMKYNVKSNVLANALVRSQLGYPEDFSDNDILAGKVITFLSPMTSTGVSQQPTSDPMALAMMRVLIEDNEGYISVETLTPKVYDKLKELKYLHLPADTEFLKQKLCDYILHFIFTGGMQFCLRVIPFVDTVSKKPAISSFVRYQAEYDQWMSNGFLATVHVGDVDKLLVPLVDGTRTVAELCKAMEDAFKEKKMMLTNLNNEPIADVEKHKAKMNEVVTQLLGFYACDGLLIE